MKSKIFILSLIVLVIMLFFSCEADNPNAPDYPAEGEYTGNAYSFIVWATPHILMVDGSSSSVVAARLRDHRGSGVPDKSVLFQLYYNQETDVYDPDNNSTPVDFHLDGTREEYGFLTNQTAMTDLGGVARTVYYSPTDPFSSIFVSEYGAEHLVPTGAALYMVVKGTVSVDLDVRQIVLINWYPIMLYWPY